MNTKLDVKWRELTSDRFSAQTNQGRGASESG